MFTCDRLQLNHVLNDPQMLQQAFDAMRNPDLMRERMASTDRALAHIESHPEGFNALRRMYETLQVLHFEERVWPFPPGREGQKEIKDATVIEFRRG